MNKRNQILTVLQIAGDVLWDGNCKVEREWKGDRYKEERDCRGMRTPTAMVVYPPWIIVQVRAR